MSKTPPRRVPIVPYNTECISDYRANVIRVKDKEKIDKFVELAKELGLLYSVGESFGDPNTTFVVEIPYKEKVIIEEC